MSAKQSRKHWPLILALVITSTGIYFAAARTRARFSPANKLMATVSRRPDQPESAGVEVAQEYVRRSRLRPQLHAVLNAMGNRLEKPGKERLTLTGTITSGGSKQIIPALLVREFPERLRLEEQLEGERRVTVFDGNSSVRRSWSSHGRRDEDLVETLAHDSVEHFLFTQTGNAAIRYLGARFRPDDGTDPNYAGPFYDLYEMTELIKLRREMRRQTKLYYFNSDTHLLERVKYQVFRDGIATTVEVRLNNWQEVQGQRLPGEIVRLENDAPVLTFTVTSFVISARAADGLFGGQ
jgi:hypothetical protein